MSYLIINRSFNYLTGFFILFFIVFYTSNSFAEGMKEDNAHVRKWNKFATDLHELHKKQTANKKITIKSKKGGYASNKEFYLEKEHYDEQGKLLSRIAWELEKADNIHVIEIYIYNDDGKVIRDYSAAFLPQYRNAPVQTLISLHQYNDGLHAFRSFDASGDKILERCEGKYKNKEISFMLDEDELYELTGDEDGMMYSKDYKLCFNNLQETVGKYSTPQ
jgi:hypothetical protein